ncbi:KH domain-containing; RNA-binding; signal transduction-associated protein 2, partial [Camelus dromedarius]
MKNQFEEFAFSNPQTQCPSSFLPGISMTTNPKSLLPHESPQSWPLARIILEFAAAFERADLDLNLCLAAPVSWFGLCSQAIVCTQDGIQSKVLLECVFCEEIIIEMDKHAATFPCTRGTLTVCILILQERSQHSVAFFMRKSGVDTRLITTTFHLFSFQDYNDEIRQEQLRELSYLNGSEDSGRGRGIRGRGTRIAPTAPSRGRGGAIPPPPPPGRGVLTPRGTTVTRGALPVPPVARGVPTPRARGSPTVPGYRAPPPPAHEGYEEY